MDTKLFLLFPLEGEDGSQAGWKKIKKIKKICVKIKLMVGPSNLMAIRRLFCVCIIFSRPSDVNSQLCYPNLFILRIDFCG